MVWCYIFSRMDENKNATIFSYEILSRFSISKSTLQRIVNSKRVGSDLGVTWRWASNTLIIIPTTKVDDLAMTSERLGDDLAMTSKQEKNKRKTTSIRKPPSKIYSKCVAQYDIFCNDISGVGCKMDGLQGKSMKQIIKYLKEQCSNKKPESSEKEVEDMIFKSWRYILSNWNKLDDFNRNRMKLNEINSSLINILAKQREVPIDKKQKKRYEQISQAVKRSSDTDYSELG